MTPHKYRAKKCEVDGITFPSLKQGRRYSELKLLERAGHIMGLSLEVTYTLAPSVILHGRKKPVLKYIADFVYIEGDETIVEDCKGMRTAVYRIKQHLMKSIHGIDIRET
jgi:hypothetical protein